jgi:hypothetical protein
MKKITLILMVVTLVFSVSSCKKDKEDPTYSKSQLIGKWKQTSPALESGQTSYITFTDTKYKASSASNGMEVSMDEMDYTFDGKSFTVNMGILGNTVYTITGLSATTLSVSSSWNGFAAGDYTYTKVQ